MQLTFLILLLSCCVSNSSSTPSPHPDSTWRPSRYIIDNRRNALFSRKPYTALLQQPPEYPPRETANFNPNSFKSRLFSAEGYHKDLAAEASIAGAKFYRKYGENALPIKVIKSLRKNGDLAKPSESRYSGEEEAFENRRNGSGVPDPQNLIQNEDDVFNEVTSIAKTATTTEKALPWMEKIDDDVLTSETSSTATTSKEGQSSQLNERFDFGSPTTTSFPWELANAKTEQGNQIDNPNEKHVYETRIETVSYHQEVIFNAPKKENWFREELKQEPNYEAPEENYEEPEKRYEAPEENYEAPEKNYELDEPRGGIHSAESEENQNKFGYVVEGSNYRKYRVEERTVDGFIVGEYGVVSHDDGSLRGVRYTAEGNTNPQLIYETLIKFLSL